jgi:uncharacterized protein (TIGR03437 family)
MELEGNWYGEAGWRRWHEIKLKVWSLTADQANGDMRLPIIFTGTLRGGTAGLAPGKTARVALVWTAMFGLSGALWGQLPNNPPTPSPAGQQVVVRARDPRIVFQVDGADYRGAASFLWPIGSKHILTAPVRLLDENFPTPRCQYWVPDNSTRWCDFGWKENTGFSQASSDRYQTITVGADTTWFELQHQTEHKITLNFSNASANDPTVAEAGVACGAPGTPVPAVFRTGVVTVGGNCFLSNASLWLAEGVVPINAFPFPGFVFLGWAVNGTPPNGFARQIAITQPINLVARFSPAKRLVMRTSPELLKVRVDHVEVLTAGGEGPCSFFGQQLPYVNPTIRPLCTGEFDLAPDSNHIVGAPSPQVDKIGRLWVFDKFSNGQPNDSLYAVGPISTNNQYEMLTAMFLPGVSTSITTKPAGLKVVIDGRDNWPANHFVFPAGKKIQVSAPAEQTDARGRRYIFKSWSNGGEATQELTVPDQANGLAFSIVAEYELLSQLTIKSNPFGAPVVVDGNTCATPCTIDRRDGTAVTVSAPATHALSDVHRFEFTGWSDGAEIEHPFTLAGAETQSLTANFRTAYRLQVTTDPEGAAQILTDPASTDGFYAADTFLTVSAKAKPGYKFRRWNGDLSGTFTSATTLLSRPRSAVAAFDKVPYISEAGVRNAAAEIPSNTVAPGSLIAIVGENLAADYVQGPSNPLSQSVGDVSVIAGDRILPLVFVSPTQINAQLPLDIQPGEFDLTVKRVGASDVTGKFTVTAFAPGLFHKMVESKAYTMSAHADGSSVDSERPAAPGETVTLYGTGFGRYEPNMLDGFAFPPLPEFKVAGPVELWSGDKALSVKWAGGITGQVGMVGVRFQIPDDATTGEMPVTVKMDGMASNTVLIPVVAPPAQ